MNSFTLALDREAEVRDYYRSLADKATLPGVKTIFSLLSADEQKHYEMIQSLSAASAVKVTVQSPTLGTAKDILETFMGSSTVAASLQTDLASYEHALAAEAESIGFYERLLAEETDAFQRGVLEKILGEERQHYAVVENLYEFVLKPAYYLAWVEFSNLREL